MLLVNAVNTEGRPLEIFVKDGRIAAVGQELEALAGDNETVVDAGGLTVLPAFVDLHCHWRTPGFEYKEDVETGSRAAAAGGYTFVNLMPNTKPVCSSAAQAMQVEQKAAEVIGFDVLRRARFGAADKEELADLFLKAHVCDDVVDALVGRFFHRLRRNRRRGGRGIGVRRVLPLCPAGGKQQKKRKQKRTQSGRFHQKISFHQDAAVIWCSR